MSDTDSTYDFLSAILFYQLFDLLVLQADHTSTGHLNVPVRFMLDEFANIGVIPHFDKTIATLRSRHISTTIILQSLAQLKSLYQKKSDIIIDCCDTLIFLGGKSIQTTKDISAMIGKTTIDHRSHSQTKGTSGSFSQNEQILGRPLIDPSEINALSRQECLVLIAGLPPFRSLKYPTNRHPRFHFLADAGRSRFVFTPHRVPKDNPFYSARHFAQMALTPLSPPPTPSLPLLNNNKYQL
jgi:type IV secretion system protein VirD4